MAVGDASGGRSSLAACLIEEHRKQEPDTRKDRSDGGLFPSEERQCPFFHGRLMFLKREKVSLWRGNSLWKGTERGPRCLQRAFGAAFGDRQAHSDGFT